MSDTAVMRRDKFMSDFRVNVDSGVGVTIVRTLEPFRAEEAILDVAITLNRQFYTWDMSSGWKKLNMAAPSEMPTNADKSTTGGVPALDYVVNTAEDNALMVMQWPHHMMKNLPPMVQKVAQLSRLLPTGRKRLVLIVPVDYEVPSEIREMMSLMDFEVPDYDEGYEIFQSCIECVEEAKQPRYSEEDIETILNVAAGLTEVEAENAFSKALVMHRERLPHLPLEDFIKVVAQAKTEAVKRSDVLELMESGSPDDIGGLDALKDWVSVVGQCMTEEAKEAGVDQPKGVFLAGPPGTGKSASAKAIAGTLQLPLIKFDVSRVFSSLVGSSEQRIKQALKLIESMAPCVALVDEVDKVFNVNSGGGDSGVGTRVLGTMLTFMQESDRGVFWVVTANRVEGLPPELLRKGRLDETFSVSVPNEEEREAIFGIHLAKRKQSIEDIEDIDVAVEASNGYVPAELEAAVKEAVKTAFVNGDDVTGELIKQQLHEMKPLSEAFKDQFESMQSWAENNARPASKYQTSVRQRGRQRNAEPNTSTVGTRRRSRRSLDG